MSLGNLIKDGNSKSTVNWQELQNKKTIKLYAGDVGPDEPQFFTHVGLSLSREDDSNIKHNLTEPIPLPEDSVEVFQSQDVYEHIKFSAFLMMINEVYRILKPGALFRLSMPDYNCDVLYDRSFKTQSGEIVFDPGGGGELMQDENNIFCVGGGGHLWFPTYEVVAGVVAQSDFKTYEFLHYYPDESRSHGVTKQIDYSLGHIQRTPDHDKRVQDPFRPMSLVVDLYKEQSS